jgi:hypothetical protein
MKTKTPNGIRLSKSKLTLLIISCVTFFMFLLQDFHWFTALIFAFALSGLYNAFLLLRNILRYAFGLAITDKLGEEEMWE